MLMRLHKKIIGRLILQTAFHAGTVSYSTSVQQFQLEYEALNLGHVRHTKQTFALKLIISVNSLCSSYNNKTMSRQPRGLTL
jgi:hypothetical protein